MKKKYDREFKMNTVRLIQEEGKTVAQVARELGISEITLYRWMAEYKKDIQSSSDVGNRRRVANEPTHIRLLKT
ncbi:transposase [Paenibacillus sp. NEAU-GSW1]|uniref:transposase n=1 Tax=Paenibacillus sp. NEAU-GSW1 TaxID=2682486 RepID=UPI0012E11DF8|nr:transposase [Paenibacillus sp. NEAU-GSW1]MUT68326.1 transposase [Paenibacillus sp. NEAU-GSW1]